MKTQCHFCKEKVDVRNTVPMVSPKKEIINACITHAGVVREFTQQVHKEELVFDEDEKS